ncbi:hypothetical protein N658DRAFT_562121 [Parathielavia hyrcaniae]|uniref:Uncharacterized protein n=1 Tax=Parathielavia hyrcaniae TaxID=113614 RepID=A0AAN6PVP4_9PEZI|nr:hypothetical protein N658DRAFT_562121 [Parathielavia hyrcaniae]
MGDGEPEEPPRPYRMTTRLLSSLSTPNTPMVCKSANGASAGTLRLPALGCIGVDAEADIALSWRQASTDFSLSPDSAWKLPGRQRGARTADPFALPVHASHAELANKVKYGPWRTCVAVRLILGPGGFAALGKGGTFVKLPSRRDGVPRDHVGHDFKACKVRINAILNGSLAWDGPGNTTISDYQYFGLVHGMNPEYANTSRSNFPTLTTDGNLTLGIVSNWILPILALLAVLPYDSLHGRMANEPIHQSRVLKTLGALNNWIGSPQTALTATLFNIHLMHKCHRETAEFGSGHVSGGFKTEKLYGYYHMLWPLARRPMPWWIIAFTSLAIVWLQIGMAVMISYNTPTVGIACGSGSYLIYGSLSSLSWFCQLLPPFKRPGVMRKALCHTFNPFSVISLMLIILLLGVFNKCLCKGEFSGYMDFENPEFYRNRAHFDVSSWWTTSAGGRRAPPVFQLAVHRRDLVEAPAQSQAPVEGKRAPEPHHLPIYASHLWLNGHEMFKH